MTKPLLAILLLLPLSVSAGELDGKSLVCERLNPQGGMVENIRYSPFMGIKFSEGESSEWRIVVIGTRAELVPFSSLEYRATFHVVTWGVGRLEYILDRKSLVLMYPLAEGGGVNQFQCEVHHDVSSFNNTMEVHRAAKQSQVDALTKDNKI
ncbi:hypothetical protein N9U55_01560 [Luminiphilus sp.]|nr:hypothetical protein [Luminiphilus sp.]MDA9721949.1 hypothetical protein [Luminiphilus sp.]